MTSLLKHQDGELFIFRSEREFPKRDEIADLESYEYHLANWFSSSERIKVAEGEKGKFNKFILFGKHTMFRDDVRHLDWDWIEIPSDCYEVRDTFVDYGELAYFKDDRADKKETEDGEIYNKALAIVEENFKGLNELIEDASLTEFYKSLAAECMVQFRQENLSHEPKAHPTPIIEEELKQHAIQFAEWLRNEAAPLAPNKQEWRVNRNGQTVLTIELYWAFLSRK